MSKEQEEIKFRKEISRWYQTFLGIRQSHTYWVYKVIDEILNENKQIGGIIEIGTGRGAMSILFGLECYEREYKPLLTYDFVRIKEPKLFNLLGIKYIVRDCFHKESIREIREYSADVPIFLMCDGGNKAKEFNTIIEYLKPGSILAAHDWNEGYNFIRCIGMRRKFITESIDKYKLQPIKESEWDKPPDHIKTCFWRKTI